VLNNHDNRRSISRYAAGESTEARAKVAATMLLTLRGTPFLYYGEELGLPEGKIPRAEIVDPPIRTDRPPDHSPGSSLRTSCSRTAPRAA
jgi:alpha-glucosidase